MGIEQEFEQHNNQKSWSTFFGQLLHASCGKHESSAKDARRPKFRNRNRYADVSPYDHSRVRLLRNNIDYINASLVMVPEADRSYILTQGPLKDTAGHFWLMVWEQNSRAVVMLNRVIEKEQVKCYQYFPVGQDNEGDDEMVFNDVGLKVTYIAEKHSNYHFTTRVFQLTDLESDESREVLQFHYTAWPDFGVPESPTAFLEFLLTIRDNNVLNNPEMPPIIHCSAGIGRSGTICLVDTCLVKAGKNGGDLNSVNVVELLLEMRRYRMGLIQTPDQLRFSYLAIIEGAKQLFQDNSSRKNTSVEYSSDGQFDELDAINSFDSVIDSFEATDNNIEAFYNSKPSSTAQARLESLFLPPDPVVKTDQDFPMKSSPGNSNVLTSLQTGTKEAPTNNSQSRLESRDIPVAVSGEQNSEESRGLLNRHVASADSSNKVSSEADFKRVRDERVKATAENIARIKQRMHESEQQSGNQPYVIAVISVAFAVVGYLTYMYVM